MFNKKLLCSLAVNVLALNALNGEADPKLELAKQMTANHTHIMERFNTSEVAAAVHHTQIIEQLDKCKVDPASAFGKEVAKNQEQIIQRLYKTETTMEAFINSQKSSFLKRFVKSLGLMAFGVFAHKVYTNPEVLLPFFDKVDEFKHYITETSATHTPNTHAQTPEIKNESKGDSEKPL
jgi:hypothetical protein